MNYLLDAYEPRDLMRYFEDLTRIPHGSGNEKAVSDYVCGVAKACGLEYYQDAANNVMVWKPASPGCEKLPYVTLQAHMDMVCVKLPESPHDFTKDPLPLVVDPETKKLKADGTTLGADDGCGVAYMLALMSRRGLVHPPLEFIFTTEEEIGLRGAEALEFERIRGRRLINLDFGSPENERCVVTSAGGIELHITRKAEWQPFRGEAVEIFLHGLKGGHSGVAIGFGRGSAGKLLARLLNHLRLNRSLTLAAVNGGKMQNAIMSDIRCVIAVENAEAAIRELEQELMVIREELRVVDPGFAWELKLVPAPEKMLTQAMSDDVLHFALAMPNGVRDMNPEIPGAVLNSNNLASIRLDEKEAFFWTLGRSNEDSRGLAMEEEIRGLAAAFGFTTVRPTLFKSWKYNPDSGLRQLHARLFREHFGKEIKPVAIHGGLECGVFYSKDPAFDIICIGPKRDNAHTTEEYLLLDSFGETLDYLMDFLKELTKE